VLRHPELDVTCTLIVGDGEALLVDTLSHAAQARALGAAARQVTKDPWWLVNTHHHFDHCFGNRTLVDPAGRGVWAHRHAAAQLAAAADELTARWQAQWAHLPDLAAGLAAVSPLVPDRLVDEAVTITVGGRPIRLMHPGPGHTAGDLAIYVDDVQVLVAGDLVESSGPPGFEDALVLAWPAALERLLAEFPAASIVLPGHGPAVGREFVERQQAMLAGLAALIVQGYAAGEPAGSVAARAAMPGALLAVQRGYGQLDAGACLGAGQAWDGPTGAEGVTCSALEAAGDVVCRRVGDPAAAHRGEF